MGACYSNQTETSLEEEASTIMAITRNLNLPEKFSGLIKNPLFPGSFTEPAAIKEKYRMVTFLTDEEAKQLGNKVYRYTSCEKMVTDKIIVALSTFYQTHRGAKYRSLTFGQRLYIEGELSRNFVAHVIGDEIKFAKYELGYQHAGFSDERVKEFAKKILTSVEQLNPTSSDRGVVKAIGIRLCIAIIKKLQTFKAEELIEQIFDKMYNDIEEKRNEDSNDRVRRLVGV